MLNDKTKLEELFIAADDSLYRAIEVIGRAGKGATKIALVVDRDTKLVGILNDGDIRRALLAHASLNEPASKYMTRDYQFLTEGDGRSKAIRKMKTFSVAQVPVIDSEKRVVGIHFWQDFIIQEPLNNAAVIMAGGKGTRLRPVTENIPKPMIRVAGTPILEHIIYHLVGYGIKTIFLAVNYKAEFIKDYFGDGAEFGCSIEYIEEDIPLGTAGALSLLPQMDEDVLLMNGDLISQFNVRDMIETHRRRGNDITVGAKDHIEKISYGVLNIDDGKVSGVMEKPENHYLVNGGIYVIKPEILKFVAQNKAYYATDLINDCLDRDREVGYYLLGDDWIDIGEHEQLNRARGTES